MHYGEKSDELYLRLDDSKIIESAEVQPGIVLDYDANTTRLSALKSCVSGSACLPQTLSISTSK